MEEAWKYITPEQGVYEVIPSNYLISKNTRQGFVGAFIAGILGGVFSSPCSTQVLIALLAIVAGKRSIFWGILLLLMYSIGHGRWLSKKSPPGRLYHCELEKFVEIGT